MPLRLAGIALAAALVLTGGWLWFRDSQFVRVDEVHVVGLSSSEERAIRSAVEGAALDMTTLHVREDDLREAVERFPTVADVRADADFPRTLTVEVVEREPVAVVEAAGARVPVGAGGLLMRGVRAGDDLPTVEADRLAPGGRVTDRAVLGAVSVLAAAPPELRARVELAHSTSRGLVLEMREGPDLIFGGPSRPRAKWAAAVRVLAHHTSAGALYLDLRVPERVAAGGVGPLTNPQAEPEVTATLDQQ